MITFNIEKNFLDMEYPPYPLLQKVTLNEFIELSTMPKYFTQLYSLAYYKNRLWCWSQGGIENLKFDKDSGTLRYTDNDGDVNVDNITDWNSEFDKLTSDGEWSFSVLMNIDSFNEFKKNDPR